jgi:hypothetical protein
MRTNQPSSGRSFDRTLRVVMWMDAFLSVALVVVSFFAVPIVATVGVPQRIVFAVGLVSIVSAVLLAAFGAITAVALMRRMYAGNYLLPPDLRLPLPSGMRPTLVGARSTASLDHS